MNFITSYSKEKDIQNYLNAGWRFTYMKHGRENIQENLLKRFPESFRTALTQAPDETSARKVVEDWLNSKDTEYQRITDLTIKTIQMVLDQEKSYIIQLLESVYQEKFPFDEISVFLTTFPIHPYSFENRWFMIGRMSHVPGMIGTAKHELNHFMFYYYFLDDLTKRGIKKEKREQLKEALAILTNPEGNDKPAVKELENFIKPLAGKPAREIIESCVQSGLL